MASKFSTPFMAKSPLYGAYESGAGAKVYVSNRRAFEKLQDDIVSGTRSIVKDLVLWCQEPFIRSSKRGIYDASPNGNDLIYNQSKPTTPRDFIITDTYTQNINKRVSTLEEISLLPFGGFPGTDGYSYTRSDVR